MSVTVAGKRRALVQQQDMAALALRPVDRVRIENAPLVFVGYGVSAPERGWDDYKDVDLARQGGRVPRQRPGLRGGPG